MITVYDMTTGQIIDSEQPRTQSGRSYRPERMRSVHEQLQPLTPSQQTSTESQMPPDLAGAALNVFLQRMR
jgi:hypothetical protein